MAKLVFRLNHVPDTEAEAVKALLEQHQFDFYETHAGRWGFSVAGLWLKNDDDFAAAREVIDAFQKTHQQKMRDEYEQAKEAGELPTFWTLLKANPILYISYWGLIVAVLALTLLPIFGFFNN